MHCPPPKDGQFCLSQVSDNIRTICLIKRNLYLFRGCVYFYKAHKSFFPFFIAPLLVKSALWVYFMYKSCLFYF